MNPPAAAAAPRQDRPLDILSAAALIYLALPVLIFLGAWFKLPVALVLAGTAAFGLRQALAGADLGRRDGLPALPVALAAVAAALAWSTFGGAGHFLFANSDWITRDAVLRDLTLSAWPPRYGSAGHADVILRAPIGYFLPAAALGAWLGVAAAHTILWLWTAAGVALFLLLLPLPERASRLALALAVVVLFSGMDIVGWLAFEPRPPQAGDHLEWWARWFQYSSHTTQLFWVPNHALPGWIAAALFHRHWRAPEFPRFAPMLVAAIALWSPFAAIGMVPFYALLAGRLLGTGDWKEIRLGALLPALLILAVCALYFSLDIAAVPARMAMRSPQQLAAFLSFYLPFIILECGLAILALYLLGADRRLLTASFVALLILPLFQMGPGNDLVMRASIPALAMLCLLALIELQRGELWARPAAASLLVAVLAIGAITPLEEFYRSLAAPRWAPDLRADLITASDGRPPLHYIARLNQPALAWLLKAPANVPAY